MHTKIRHRKRGKTPSEVHIFLPDRRFVIGALIGLAGLLCVCSYFLYVSGGLLLWLAILLMSCLFAFLFFPFSETKDYWFQESTYRW